MNRERHLEVREELRSVVGSDDSIALHTHRSLVAKASQKHVCCVASATITSWACQASISFAVAVHSCSMRPPRKSVMLDRAFVENEPQSYLP